MRSPVWIISMLPILILGDGEAGVCFSITCAPWVLLAQNIKYCRLKNVTFDQGHLTSHYKFERKYNIPIRKHKIRYDKRARLGTLNSLLFKLVSNQKSIKKSIVYKYLR